MTDVTRVALRVLFVEDSEDDTELVLRLLRKDGFAPVHRRVEDDQALQRALREEPWDLVLCDYSMPRFGAPQALATFKGFHIDIPLIVFSGTIGEETAVQMMKAGAHDYVMKQNPVRLVPAIRRELQEAHERAARRHAEKELTHLAYYDQLTGLPNRTLLLDRVEQAMVYARRDGIRMALIQLGIDRFKSINEAVGEVAGDHLLYEQAKRLQGALGDDVTVARTGGSTFAVLITRISEAQEAQRAAETLRGILAQPVVVSGREVNLSASAGLALFPDHGTDAKALILHAESAVYDVRTRGGNAVALYSPESDVVTERRFTLENDLRRALREHAFEVHYQPQLDLESGAVSVEALVRWRDPVHGLVPPDHFIGLAEELGIIVPLGAWVLQQACQDYAVWRESGYAPHRLSVNLSMLQLQHASINDNLERAHRHYFSDGRGALEVEVTESVLMHDTGRIAALLGKLRAQGIRIALDDFGTGYSSLAYLRHLPIDRLKIDKSFIKDLASNTQDQAIVTSVIALARSLNMRVLAEGVETDQQLAFLRRVGCDAIQGYLLSQPLSRDKAAEFIGARRERAAVR